MAERTPFEQLILDRHNIVVRAFERLGTRVERLEQLLAQHVEQSEGGGGEIGESNPLESEGISAGHGTSQGHPPR